MFLLALMLPGQPGTAKRADAGKIVYHIIRPNDARPGHLFRGGVWVEARPGFCDGGGEKHRIAGHVPCPIRKEPDNAA